MPLKQGETQVINPVTATGSGSTVGGDEQKRLRKFVERRHPKYKQQLPHWNFMQATYEGGREWFETNVFRYIKEGDKEYGDRLKRLSVLCANHHSGFRAERLTVDGQALF